MKEKNNNKGVIICLLFTIIVLVVIIIMLVTGNITVNLFNNNNETKPDIIDNNQNNINNNDSINNVSNNNSNSKVNSISDVSGSYKAEFNNLKTDSDTNSASITLNLYENGIFTFVYSQQVPTGVIGNYVVNNNKIIFTNWFKTYSDVSLPVTSGSKELIINSDGSITDNNVKEKSLIDNNITSVKLIKSNEKLQNFDISDRLAAAFFNESNHEKAKPNF